MKKTLLLSTVVLPLIFSSCKDNNTLEHIQSEMLAGYGINKVMTGSYDKSLSVKCHNGIFVGKKEGDVISFKGIPYAKPPVKSRRWKVAESADESNKVREAYYFGKSAIQTKTGTERASLYLQSEDCLTLNVWVNKKDTRTNKTVMVFFHGGSYGWGGTADPLYDGSNFVRRHPDIILVTANYRTGIMGFIDLSSLKGSEEYKESPNLGLLDQIEALRYVQRNIGAFGGDKNNVTIFGESAGAGSVSLLPIVSKAKGLFRRVIAESGSIALTYSKSECRPLTEKLIKLTGVKSVRELVALDERIIKELNEKLNDINCFPQRDGITVPLDVYAAYDSGMTAGIDIMNGTNADEARYWIGEMGGLMNYKLTFPIMFENNIARISKNDRVHLKEFMQLQKDKEKIWKITEFYNEIMFRIPAIYQTEAHAKNGGRAYMYYWTYPSAIPNYGACHAVELAYVFGNLDQTIYTGNNINKNLALTVQDMWAAFARTGNPSTNGIEWNAYDMENRTTMILGEDIHTENAPLENQRRQLASLLKYNFNGCYTNLSLFVPSVFKLAAFAIIVIALIIFAIIFLRG